MIFFPSLTYVKSYWLSIINRIDEDTRLIHSGPFIILMFLIITSVAWYRVSTIGRRIVVLVGLLFSHYSKYLGSGRGLRRLLCIIPSLLPHLFLSHGPRKKKEEERDHTWPAPSRIPPPSKRMFLPPKIQNVIWVWYGKKNAFWASIKFKPYTERILEWYSPQSSKEGLVQT